MKFNWNDAWLFTKDAAMVSADHGALNLTGWEKVDLPHTWNAKDGQDGGNDYYRGTCYYTKKLALTECNGAEEVYIEFDGANSSADVYVNGTLAVHHDGGYSTFRANITELLKEENEIVVAVDNAPNDRVYPQMADFTFYGGIYRDVNIICVPKAHFDLDFFGGPGIQVTPVMDGADAKVNVIGYFTGLSGDETVKYVVKAGDAVAFEREVSAKDGKVDFVIANAHLWNGRKDPFLYTLEATLLEGEKELDARTVRFGCRSFSIDPERGFILNGEEYPLRGVSRHQDRKDIGNALLPKHHKEDAELIYEVGATTIRLAHYQHAQYFYDLCDEMGFVLWAEIPYISNHMPKGRENTISQMKELLAQNYNHPSIFVWGLSNEISMKGADDPDLLENHRILNDFCHEWDKTRLTTMAIVSMCPTDSEYVKIPDTVSWNHYFGWYGGDTSMNGPWMDKFHAEHPTIPVGMSEYGCEALNWHNSNPEQGDYSEEYQAYYHEELIKQLFTRKYIWATHVWNMFDFAADSRAEGGEDGMNHKGLMNFDRTYKKDAFYAYKAWLSDEPFVHICSKRYVDRVEEVTKVTVYSNLPEVELFANGKSLGKQTSDVHFFYFEVPNEGTTELVAKAGNCEDKSTIVKVDKFNDAYRIVETGDVLNWFEITAPEGYYSINDKASDVLATTKGKLLFIGLMKKAMKGKKTMVDAGSMMDNKDMMGFLGGFTVKRLLSMMGAMGAQPPTKEEMLKLNKKLNKIKKK
ncbi:MAG: glycoside hydrolase family 2 protein [Lachnospiraceae bacterium]|nr:glycoside hydrolase family 2 protein [Lachnospiraceae bacterium]